MVLRFLKSDTVDLLSDKAWKKTPPQRPLVYLLSFAKSLDPYGIMNVLFGPIITHKTFTINIIKHSLEP